ncbi:MAG: DUF4364 family protein [Clostridia bacterium]|nr:DUF4364 family protein [Clostridia bacterium]
MNKDASGAGVARGGLFSTAEIKILICYILNAIDKPVPAQMLANVLHFEGIANAFEVSDAVVSLASSGQIVSADSDDKTYAITNAGRDTAATLKSSLSSVVKERAYLAVMKMFAKFKNAKDNQFEITHEHGATYLSCSALDGGKPFLTIKLLITDENQGNFIRDKFLENPSKIYSKIIEMLTQ